MITLQILSNRTDSLVFQTKYHMKFDTDNDKAVTACMVCGNNTVEFYKKKSYATVSLMAKIASN